ncbi:hypothetical protein JXR01_01630 [Candidatus Kaiserbacteria bacterium]|nr:MAG: hypothetical protein JXR01_01630 [Candidatus Kaiserbacteria bacterium]
MNEGKIIDLAAFRRRFEEMTADERIKHIEKKILEHGSNSLSLAELKFLYGFGVHADNRRTEVDPRITTILEKRNLENDLEYVFELDPNEISLSNKDIFKEGIKLHYGNVEFAGSGLSKIILPDTIIGDISLPSLAEIKELKLPKELIGDIYVHPNDKVEMVKRFMAGDFPEDHTGFIYIPNLGLDVSEEVVMLQKHPNIVFKH